MNTNFYEAFLRHANDADLLMASERWANADHLFGLAAECALKAILLQQGIPSCENLLQQGIPSCENGDICKDKNYKKYRKHINDIWDQYQNYMQTRLCYLISEENPFKDWNIADRYAPNGAITKETAQNHRVAFNEVRELIKKAELDGVIL